MARYVDITVLDAGGGLNRPEILAHIAAVRQQPGNTTDVLVLPRATRGGEYLSDMARYVLGVFELPQPGTVDAGRHAITGVTDEPTDPEQAQTSQPTDDTGPAGGRHSAHGQGSNTGYTLHFFPYDDKYSPDAYSMAVVIRSEMERAVPELVQLAGTNALRLTLDDDTEEGVHLLALDLDRYSGDRRRYQYEQAMRSVGRRVIMAGGFSATHKRGFWPHTFQLARPAMRGLARILPSRRPASAAKAGRGAGGRQIDALLNLADMTNGKMMAAFKADGLHDASVDFAPTEQVGFMALQTHHILQRDIGVVRPTRVHRAHNPLYSQIDAVFNLGTR